MILTKNQKKKKVIVSRDKNNPKAPTKYQLSGIGQVLGARRRSKYLLAHRDKDMAYIGAPRWNHSKVIAVRPIPHIFDRWVLKPHHLEGYTLHSRCWTLMENTIRPEIGTTIHDHLDRVVAALHNQWERIIAHLQLKPDYYPYSFDRQFRCEQKWGVTRINSGRDLNDPLYMSLLVKQSQYNTTRRAYYLTRKFGLPLEIKFIIIEYLLDNFQDISNTLIAFEELLPPHYWMKHIPDNVLPEIVHIDLTTMNWPYFIFMLKQKDPKDVSDAIWNRNRIMGMLDSVRDDILNQSIV